MKIAVSAYPITYHENFSFWQKHIESWIQIVSKESPDLIVFPEYGSMELVSIFSEEIRNDLNKQIQEMQKIWKDFQSTFASFSKKYNCIIVAPSFPVKVEEYFVNRAMVFSPNGNTGYQDKWFMTPFERFDWHINSGEKTLTVFETPKGNFGIQICYDGEFAIGSRYLSEAGADIVLMPSCTETIRGAIRVHVGARARAMENQCYALVSQTIGLAEWSPAVDINYGYTGAYSTPDFGFPEDGILAENPHQSAGWLIHHLNVNALKKVRYEGAVRGQEDHEKLEMKFKNEDIQIRKVIL